MIVFILLWILYCLTDGFEEAWYTTINHRRATLNRIAMGIVIVYGICGAGNDWILYINTTFTLAFTFTVFFDIARNLASREKWNYIGETAELDKILRKNPRAAWSAKFILAGLSIIAQFYNSTYIVKASPLINTTWLF